MCIFCQIASGEIPADILYQDEEILAFKDISPQAPTHVLIIPKKHIARLSDCGEGEEALLGRMIGVANKLAKDQGISEKGYRLAVNCGKEGGQVVEHLHMHLLGGRQLSGQLG